MLKDNKGEVKIPQGVTEIGVSAFFGRSYITNITFPNSVMEFGERAFWGCSALTSITISKSVTKIGDNVFKGCSSLASIIVSGDNRVYYSKNNCLIEKASKTLIAGCKESVMLGDGSVTKIGNSAFSYCRLKEIIIPDCINEIGEYAFDNCTGLTSITIPKSVASIGYRAFSMCSALASITVSKDNKVYCSKNNCIIERASKTLIAGCNKSIIPDDGSVAQIGKSAFMGCRALTSITIPNSVTTIGVYAFSQCEALTNVTIPKSVTSIGWRAFWYCLALTSVTIPNSVTTIGKDAFYACWKLRNVTMPKKLKPHIDEIFGKDEKEHIKFTFTK